MGWTTNCAGQARWEEHDFTLEGEEIMTERTYLHTSKCMNEGWRDVSGSQGIRVQAGRAELGSLAPV